MRISIVIAPLVGALAFAGAAMADPISSAPHQCAAPWSSKTVADTQCKGTGRLAEPIDTRGQPRRLSKADIRAELAQIRMDDAATVNAPVLLRRGE